MKKAVFLFLFMALNICVGQVISGHPKLFIDSALQTKLAQRATNNTPEWQRVKGRMDAYMDRSGEWIIADYIGQYEYILTYALGYYATNNQAYIDKSIEILMAFYDATTDQTIQFDSGYRSRSYLFSMALGYDWCYNDMTTTQRNQIRQRITTWANWIKDNAYAVYGSLYYEPGNNYSVGHLSALSATGYAIYTEDLTSAQSLLENANSTIASMMHFVNTRLRGGDANEGWSYGSGYALNLFYTFAMVKSATSDHHDYFIESTWDQEVIEFLIYASLPDREHILPNGDWARESTGRIWDQHRSVADLISTYSDIEISRQIACYWGTEVYSVSDFHNFYVWRPFIFFNNEEEAVNYKTVSPFNNRYWHFTDSIGTGQFIQRTDWNMQALWVSFRAGGMYGDHAHNGNGHFEIWKNGWLIIDENIASRNGILIPDHAHNRVQIQPMSETWNLPALGYDVAEHADILRREFTADYSYIYENSTDVYKYQKNNTATKTERQFFFMPDQKLLFIYDIAATTSQDYYKKFRLHFPGTPTQNNEIISYSNTGSIVFCHTGFPLNPNISIYASSNSNAHIADIEYTTNEQKNYFMHAIYIKETGSQPYTTEKISRASGNVSQSDLYGSSVVVENTTYTVVFLGDDPAYDYGNLAFEMTTNITSHLYVAGLQRNMNYYIGAIGSGGKLQISISTSSHSGYTSVMTTDNGILYHMLSGDAVPSPPQTPKIKQVHD